MYTAIIHGKIYVNEKGQKDIEIFSRLDDDVDDTGIFDDVDHELLNEIEAEGNFMAMVNAWFEEYRYFDVDEIDIQYEVFEIGKSEKLLYLSNAEYELRNLMNTYIKRQEKLKNEIEEAKRDGDVDGELTGEVLYRQMQHVIAELFQVMKRIGILDDDEIAFGCVKQ